MPSAPNAGNRGRRKLTSKGVFACERPECGRNLPSPRHAELLAKDGVLGAEVVNDLLLLPVGVAGDNASEQMPRLQDEVHESGPERAEALIVQHGVGVVKRPNQAPIYGTQVPFLEPLAGRLIFFTIRDLPFG